MALVVENPGVWSTIQDRGRPGYRDLGVPPAGAFDLESHELANALVGNEGDQATIELTLMGGAYRTSIPLAIALAGAPMLTHIESPSGTQRPLTVPGSASLSAGDRLVVGGASEGARTYLAVRGGWLTPVILGSRSDESPLQSAQELSAEPSNHFERRPVEWHPPNPEARPIRVLAGPDARERSPLDGLEFVVSTQSNRMGLRLQGPPVSLHTNPERVSAPVAFGAVQLAGDQLIVLGPAGGTMGGYPHLAQVISADLARLGQARPGARIRFERVELELARQLDREDRQRRRTLCQRVAWVAKSGD